MTDHIERVYIKASAQAVWDAITKPEWTSRYGYTGFAEYDLRPGGEFRSLATPEMAAAGAPEVLLDGEVLEADPPRKLVMTWRMLMDPGMAAEGFTKLTYEIEETKSAGTRLTVTHDLTGAPGLAKMVRGDDFENAGGGWSWILSDLKTLLETGSTIAG